MGKTYSMTGFGRVEKSIGNKKIIVEIKSLNSSRGAEISCKIPHLYKSKEIAIRKMVSNHLERGKIDVYISEKSANSNGTSFNEVQIGAYLSTLKKIAQENDLEAGIDLMNIALKLPDSLSTEERKVEESDWLEISAVLEQALINIKESRLQEGVKMEEDLKGQLAIIKEASAQVVLSDAPRLERIRGRIQEKLQEVIEAGKLDHNRFEQELIYYSEKIDIAEEKTRLKAHLEYFLETIEGQEVKGKKLGFICQELGREINTTGSKANDLTIQKHVVAMKEALEKIKEQVANIL